MSKSGTMGMQLHQRISFHSMMMRVPKAEAIFWPGCALMQLDHKILKKAFRVLKRREPELQLSSCCCGQPTEYLFPELLKKRQEKLVGLLRKQGVKRIYTACPNCTLQLRKLEEFEIISIWPVLAEEIKKEDIITPEGSYIWHDPCPTRKEVLQQEAVRKLLRISGCDFCEPEHTGEKTICCGNYHMLCTVNPEKSKTVRKRRLAEFPEDLTIASSCEGCLGSFKGEKRQVEHLLELLFGKSEKRSWGNRLKFTLYLCTFGRFR